MRSPICRPENAISYETSEEGAESGFYNRTSSRGAQIGSLVRNSSPLDHELSASFPGEMIDDGMEWLQSLFTSGLDGDLLPVWD